MSETAKKVILLVVAVVFGFWAIKFILGLVTALIFQIILPLAVVGAIGYGIYWMVSGKKSLGSGNRRSLP